MNILLMESDAKRWVRFTLLRIPCPEIGILGENIGLAQDWLRMTGSHVTCEMLYLLRKGGAQV